MRRLLTWLALLMPFIVTPPAVFGQSNQAARIAVDLQEIVNFKQVYQHKKFEKIEEGNLAYFQFEHIPDEQKLAELKASGFKLLSYSNDKTYLFAFPGNVNKERLRKFGIVAFAPTSKGQKLAPVVRNNMYPSHAIAADNRVKIAINFHPGFSKDRYYFLLEKYDIEVMEDNYGYGNIFTVLMEATDIDLLSEEPMISFIDVVTPPVEQLNNEVRSLQKVTYANATNGYGLNGNGVVVGVGDGGELGDHLDFQDRVINYANGTYSSFGDHGDHVAGIIGGGGIINAENRGMAAEATLVIQKTSLITYYADDYYYADNMVLTNNSYGSSFNCTSNGTYNYTSQSLDIQLRQFPEMLHIFAAGNSGAQTCSPYPSSYFTLLKYYQSAKNVLTVGNVTDTRTIKSNSSRGPASDGRLKPEICGIGTSVTSTSRNFDYTTKTGTSMAAPAVTGTMALLYESYKNQNGGSNPKGGLMKAIACNTADDLGNAGPDYTYGYGLINARRAVETIIDGRHFTNSLSDGASATHNITVPANTKQVKVMLYWQDKEAEPFPVKALINDLDLVLTNPSGTNYQPWVLNHDPAHVADVATRKIDTLNNIEQVTIDNPAAGTYAISVAGTEIPSGPQEYFVVYEFVMDDVVLTNPMGGEQFSFSDVIAIQWDADATNTSTFSVEYSTNGGSSWNLIDANVAATERSLFWSVPSEVSDNAYVRVTKNNGSQTDTNGAAFSIYDLPLLTASPACEGRVLLEWDAISGIDEYEILQFDGTTFTIFDTTSLAEYLLEDGDMVIGEQYWFAIRGLKTGGIGTRRSVAQSCIPTNNLACDWSDDIVAENLILPSKGRVMTNSALSSLEVISLQARNIGDNTVSGINFSYQVNGGTVVTESYNSALAPGEAVTYSFNQKVDMSSVGIYDIDAWVTYNDDIDISNDSIVGLHSSEQLDNDPIDLQQGILSFDLDLAQAYNYTDDEIGLEELLSWDFETEVDGTMKTGTSNGVELLIDENAVAIDPDYSNNAIITVNLSGHDLNDGLYLDFVYSNNNLFPLEDGPELQNKAFVRGSDTDSWVEAFTMSESESGWHEVNNLDIGAMLASAGQTLSTSFQIRFEENGKGLLLDDVSLRETSSLPVELINFTVVKIDGDALLKWKTGSEINNKHFEIQVASSIEQVQSGRFEVLGIVPGLGTTVEPQLYTFLDITPGKVGHYYYRLKQIDFDGKFEYSDIRELKFSADGLEYEVYPNPFVDYVSIGTDKSTFRDMQGKLYNSGGQLVDYFEIPTSGHSGRYQFDIRNELPAGNYFLHLIGEGPRKVIQIVKTE